MTKIVKQSKWVRSALLAVAGFVMAPVCGSMTVAGADAAEIPAWVEKINFKGDFRFRYQDEQPENESKERQRFRIRLRAGVTAEVTDQWEVGFGLATGGSDPRSTNQTLEDIFQTGDIRLDYAYAAYQPAQWVNINIGKFKNPIWNPKDLLWDGDIRPEGVAACFNFKTSDNLEWFLTPGFFVLETWGPRNDDLDPYMLVLQGGLKAKFDKAAYVTFGATAYMFNDVEGNSLDYSAGTNTTDAGGNLTDDHDAYSVEAEFGYTGLPVMIAAFGQYVVADVDEEDTGYLVGLKIGDKKVKKLGQWQFKYNYRDLEKDAFLDVFPDSDALGGSTGIEGSEFELAVGLAKNITFNIDYYMMEDKETADEEDLLQLDLNVKF